MHFKSKLFGRDVQILIDCGSNNDHIDLHFCRDRGYVMEELDNPKTIKLVNDNAIECRYVVRKCQLSMKDSKTHAIFTS